MGMDTYLWANRPLLVFTPDAEHQLLLAQRESLKGHTDGLRDRDIVVIEVVGDHVLANGHPTEALDADKLRQRFNLRQSEAAVLLVGKDGGLKVKKSEFLSAEALFQTIDAMPMRLQEIRDRDVSICPDRSQ